MASESPKTNTFRKKAENAPKAQPEPKKPSFSVGKIDTKQLGITFGIAFISVSIFLVVAFISYLLNGPQDQSLVMNNPDQAIRESARESRNWVGYLGAQAAHWMIYRWFGVAAFLLPPFLFLIGFRWTFKFSLLSLTKYAAVALFFTAWIGLVTGYAVILSEGYSFWSFVSGGFGYELARLSYDFLGMGTVLLIAGTLLIFITLFFGIDRLNWFVPRAKADALDEGEENKGTVPPGFLAADSEEEDIADDGSAWEIKTEGQELPAAGDKIDFGFSDEAPLVIPPFDPDPEEVAMEEEDLFEVPKVTLLDKASEGIVLKEGNFTVQKAPELEKTAAEVENLDPYDPTLDLPRYKYPTLDLLNAYDVKKVTVSRQELEENKDKIVTTLENFQIGIQGIQATIGPTVTLYEIIPESRSEDFQDQKPRR
jgi:DNA segregation ATPase FtsK/SpoIIIE, S-DNA-T family